jgi:hypothetical protein
MVMEAAGPDPLEDGGLAVSPGVETSDPVDGGGHSSCRKYGSETISWARTSPFTNVTRPPTLMMTEGGSAPVGVSVTVACSGQR